MLQLSNLSSIMLVVCDSPEAELIIELDVDQAEKAYRQSHPPDTETKA